MKHLKIAGLCLVAMLAVGMFAAASASAAPHWLVCLPAHEGTKTTKWETHQCKTAQENGAWEWSELKSTEATRSHGSLVLTDTKVPVAGVVSVQCTGEDVGSVGPGKFDRIEKINNIVCSPGKSCEAVTKTVEPRNLPWQTELYETESKIRDKVTAVNGGGAGWAVTCRVLGIEKTDVCTTEEGSTAIANAVTNGELLVLATFDTKTAHAKCELGGAGSGEVLGPDAILLLNGWALEATK